VNFNQVTKS